MEVIKIILPYIFTALGTGGLVAIIQVLAGKKKTASEVTGNLVKTAMEIEKVSTERYLTISQELAHAKKIIEGIEERVSALNRYSDILKAILIANSIEYPEMDRRAGKNDYNYLSLHPNRRKAPDEQKQNSTKENENKRH